MQEREREKEAKGGREQERDGVQMTLIISAVGHHKHLRCYKLKNKTSERWGMKTKDRGFSKEWAG